MLPPVLSPLDPNPALSYLTCGRSGREGGSLSTTTESDVESMMEVESDCFYRYDERWDSVLSYMNHGQQSVGVVEM